jgi:hypothetical protein
MREPTDDSQPVDVGEGLVDEAQLAQLLGLEDSIGDRAADVGARGAQVDLREGRSLSAEKGRINRRLYQSPLMLFGPASRCQAHRVAPFQRLAH